MTSRTDPLAIYLNDHYAGAAAGLALLRRASTVHRDPQVRAVLAELAREVGDERRTLRQLMRATGAPVHRAKVATAWLGERVSRLKPNGRVVARAPLSDFLELEALLLGVHGKWAGWRTLLVLARTDPRLPVATLEELARTAERQVATIEDLRARVVEAAFAEREVPRTA
ncbi:hypothetical protein NUM3379_29000 [Kineococcus sp. NUM-3379]